MNEGLIQVQKDSFKIGILFGQGVNFFGSRYLEFLSKSENFNTLIEMLSKKIHHVGGFMFGEGSFKFLLIVDLGFGGFGFLLGLARSFIFLWT